MPTARNISHHERFGSFTRAATSNAEAVFVELGTNAIGWINDELTLSQALVELDKVFKAVDRAVDALGDTCTVWVGLNEQWDAPFGPRIYNDIDAAAAFNDYVQSLLPAHPNLHYADYDEFARGKRHIPRLVALDMVKIHPSSLEGKVANFEAWSSELCC